MDEMASQADYERELNSIFTQHPHSHLNDAGEPVIPADALVDVFRSFTDVFNEPLLSNEETQLLKTLLANNPGLEVTPSMLLDFVAAKTRHSRSPSVEPLDDNQQQFTRGRHDERGSPEYHRSSSTESNGASYHYTSSGSRPPSRGPPQTPYGRSPFDNERRQRSTPLSNAPSSWSSKRPAPASRRRSVDGSRSDSEYSVSPSSFSRSGSRIRSPSNPTSPTTPAPELSSFSPIGSPVFSSSSRPHSRSGSHPPSAAFSHSLGPTHTHSFSIFGSPGSGDDNVDDNPTINTSTVFDYRNEDSFGNISSLPMPSASLGDSDDSDSDEESMGLVLDRHTASSTASMEPMERLEALQRVNAELGRKLMEAEKTLQNKLAEHESELEEMQSKLEEMRSELSATKREEKELRSKERQNMTQISALELEITKVSKALEHAKSTYASLQRQYQEQCSASEKYRDDLRAREELIRFLREAASLHEIEVGKWNKEQQSYEERIATLEAELNVAQQAHVQLDEQKQENLLLKETIDRMRFEMDEMRSNAAMGIGAGYGSGAGNSATNTISKSLGAELMEKMKWDGEDNEEDGEADGESEEDEGSSVATAVEHDGEDTEGEDVIQTIITRKKRKVASRAKTIETHTFEEVKEYSDNSVQYDPTLFCVTSGMQTLPEPKPVLLSSSVQTEGKSTKNYAIQTEDVPTSPPRITLDVEIQTDEFEPSRSTSPTQTDDESLASSSSTIIPPTPKAHIQPLQPATNDDHIPVTIHADSPPEYDQVTAQTQQEKDWRLINETLRRWHNGVNCKTRNKVSSRTLKGPSSALLSPLSVDPSSSSSTILDGGLAADSDTELDPEVEIEPVRDGVSEDLIEEWKMLKEELGVDCLVIDKLLANSKKLRSTSQGSVASSKANSSTDKRRGGRFYNIYNTYVYGSGPGPAAAEPTTNLPATSASIFKFTSMLSTLTTQTLLFAGASALVFMALAPYRFLPQYGAVPGGPTYYDRMAWSSFNSLYGGGGEGFALGRYNGGLGGDGADAVWKVIGRVGGGAARMMRGWPT